MKGIDYSVIQVSWGRKKQARNSC